MSDISPSKTQMNERRLLLELLDGRVPDGRLEFREHDTVTSARSPVDSGPSSRPVIALRIRRPRFFERVLAYGNLGLGEAYMDRDFDIESGTLQDFLEILLRARIDRAVLGDPRHLIRLCIIRLRARLRPKWQNVRKHYDLGDDLFSAFLDPTLTYSCGYAVNEDDSLADLQLNKFDRILRKLEVQPGDRMLDIGCGYGGLLVHAAKEYGIVGTGITNSHRHAVGAATAVSAARMTDRIHIHEVDYQDVTGKYDRVVSVGMMEHVPRREYPRFFRVLSGTLAPGGRGLLHTIGCNAARNRHDPFFQKYIFPGSNQPRLSEITRHLERSGMPILDVENVVRHYVPTTVAWLENFRRNRDTLNPENYDDRFLRMWEYYLCCGIAGAVASSSAVYQVLFARDYIDPIPLHRV